MQQLLVGVLVAVVVAACFSAANSQGVLKVGMTMSLSGNTSRVGQSLTLRNGLKFWEDWYAQQPDTMVAGQPYRLQLEIFDDESSINKMVSLYSSMLASGDYAYFLGPVGSDFAFAARGVVDGHGLLLHTAGAADAVSVGSQSCYSVLPPGSKTFSAALREARLQGARSWSYITENQSYQLSACGGAVQLAAEAGLGAPVCNFTVPNTLLGIDGNASAAIDAAVDGVSRCQQDVVVLCSYYPGPKLMIERAQHINYNAKLFLVSIFSAPYDSFEWKDYVAGYNIWSPELRYPPDPFYGVTPAGFDQAFFDKFGYRPDAYAAGGAAVPLYLLNAVQKAASVAWSDVSYSLSRTDLQTFWGRVYYAADHAALIEPVIAQYQPAPVNLTVVAPSSGQAHPLIYPAPHWDQRQQTTGWMVYAGDVVMAVLAGVAIGFSLLLCVVVLWQYNSDVMRAAQPEFVLITLFGSVLMYLSVYCWLYYVNDASCQALPWLLATGFSLIFGCLASKTWRVHRVFNNPKLRTVSISRWPLLGFVTLMCAIVWALLIPWSAADPPRARLVVPDPYRPSLNYYVCHVGDVGTGLLIAILAVEGVLLLAAALLSFRVRNVKYVLFNEAKFIGFSIYNLIIIGAVCVGLVAANLSPVTSFWVRTWCILGAALLVVCCLMLPKLYYLKRGKTRHTHSGSLPARTSGSTFAANTDDASSVAESSYNECMALRNQVAKLKQDVAALRAENDRLRAV